MRHLKCLECNMYMIMLINIILTVLRNHQNVKNTSEPRSALVSIYIRKTSGKNTLNLRREHA